MKQLEGLRKSRYFCFTILTYSYQSIFTCRVVMISRCYDACLVIDGGLSYQFNSGAKAIIEIRPEDSLRTIIVD